MKRFRSALALSIASVSSLLVLSAPLQAASRVDDALALVPADAASVGMINLADLRTSPLSARLFSETDHMAVNGDAARFLEETRLRPKEDVDLMVVAGTPGRNGQDSSGLVIFEGRFETEKIAAALASRGAIKKTSPHGDSYQLVDRDGTGSGRKSGSIALISNHLIVAGDDASVAAALVQRDSGGTLFRSGAGLGRHLSRIEPGATVWALVDVKKCPFGEKRKGLHMKGDIKVDGEDHHVDVQEGGSGSHADVLRSAFSSVSLVALQATAKGDALKLSAVGLSDNQETRELIDDSLRGILAAWRLAVQDKSPDMVSVLRKFKVSHDREGVSVSGTLSGAAVRALAEKHHAD
jgi:hypothetical protein